MTASDPTYVNLVQRHRDAALRELKDLAECVGILTGQIERGELLSGGVTRGLALTAMSLAEDVAAMKALQDVAHLATEPDAEEA